LCKEINPAIRVTGWHLIGLIFNNENENNNIVKNKVHSLCFDANSVCNWDSHPERQMKNYFNTKEDYDATVVPPTEPLFFSLKGS
jgi:hypothetical protein